MWTVSSIFQGPLVSDSVYLLKKTSIELDIYNCGFWSHFASSENAVTHSFVLHKPYVRPGFSKEKFDGTMFFN